MRAILNKVKDSYSQKKLLASEGGLRSVQNDKGYDPLCTLNSRTAREVGPSPPVLRPGMS
jgi:hypothetical protein